MDKGDHTLLIRRRFDVPFGGGDGINKGRYVLLRKGQTRIMTINLAVPVYPQYLIPYAT